MRCLASFTVAAILLAAASSQAAPRDKARRIAVLEFQNITRDKTFDWIGDGIKEYLTSELSQIPEFVVVERTRLSEAIKELNFNRSQYVDPATAQKMGKVLGVQSVVVGSYQKLGDDMRITARLVEVETGEVKAPTRVDGSFKKFLDLETQIAEKLVVQMKGALGDADRKQLQTKPTESLDAHRSLSDGSYFLRQDLYDDAISQFDQALKADSNYGEAWYYKGIALQKKKQWDEAINAFKKALPRSQSVRYDKWSWQPPYEKEKSEHGRVILLDMQRFYDHPNESEQLHMPSRTVYGEKAGNQSILHLVDLDHRNAERFVVDDPKFFGFGGPGETRGSRALAFPMPSPFGNQASPNTNVHLFDTNSRNTWQHSFDGMVMPLFFDDLVLVMHLQTGRWYGLDPESGKERWQRAGLATLVTTLSYQNTRKHGPVVIVPAATGKVVVLRADTGVDVWSADLPAKNAVLLARDGVVAALTPGGRLAAFELESGQELPLPQLELGSARNDLIIFGNTLGNVNWPPSLLRDRILYVWTKEKTLIAVDLKPDLKPGAKPESRVLWRVPMENTPRRLEADGAGVYVATEAGEVFLFDAATGKQRGMLQASDKTVTIDAAGPGVLVASSADAVYGIDSANGHKKWEYPNRFASSALKKDPRYFKGAVAFRTSDSEIVCLDAETGSLLWRHSGTGGAFIHTTSDALFVSDNNGIKEYSTERQAVAGIDSKEVYTELARTVLLQGDPKGAQVYIRKVLAEIDPNYTPARLVQARIFKAQGDLSGAGRELSAFVTLDASDSQQAKDVIAELKKDHALIWRTDADATNWAFGMQGKIIGVQGTPGDELRLYALDEATGRLTWKYPGLRFLQAVPDFEHHLVFYLTGRRENPRILDLFAVAIESGERRKVATLTSGHVANFTRFAYAAGRLYAGAIARDMQVKQSALQVFAVSAESGKVLWEKTQTGGDVLDPASALNPSGLWYGRGDVFLYSTNKDLWVVNGADGTALAHLVEANISPTGRPWEQDGPKDIFFFFGDGKIVAFDLVQKSVLWRGKVPGFSTSLSTDLIRSGIKYTCGGRVCNAVALAPPGANGDFQVLWKTEPGVGKNFQATILGGGRLFVRRDDSTLVELDVTSGKLLKEYPLLWDAGFVSVAQNTASVLSTTGCAYAIRLDASKSQ